MADVPNFQTSHTDFIPTIIESQAILAATDHTQNGCLSAARDLSDKLAKGGNKIQSGVQSRVTLSDITETTYDEHAQFSASNVSLTINVHKGVPMLITNKLRALSVNDDHFGDLLAQALAAAYKNMDASLAGLYSSAGETVTGSTGSNITETEVRAAKKQLDEAKAPRIGRYLIVNPQQEDALTGIARFTEADKIGNGAAIMSGSIGRIHGFDVFISHNIVETTDGFAHCLAGVRGMDAKNGSMQIAKARYDGINWMSNSKFQVIGANDLLTTFNYDEKGRGEVLGVEQLYGVATFRSEWLVDIKVAD